jgi:orotate phosphoribosyltransferase-like protein
MRWAVIGKAGGRMMMMAAAPLLEIERWPDINRAAVGLAGSAAAPITTLSSSSLDPFALFHPREPLRTSLLLLR